jgi:hypothetical protein
VVLVGNVYILVRHTVESRQVDRHTVESRYLEVHGTVEKIWVIQNSKSIKD